MSYLNNLLNEYGLTGIIKSRELHDRAVLRFGKDRSGWGKEAWLEIMEDVLETTTEEVISDLKRKIGDLPIKKDTPVLEQNTPPEKD